LDISVRQDCQGDILRIQELLACGVFNRSADNPLRQSAFIELVICLRDLLHKADKYSKRIDFTEDILQNEYVKDVTDAVTAIRNACCHIDSFNRNFDDFGNRGAYIVLFGRGRLVTFGDLQVRNDYDDDVAFYYGKNRLYLKRHIIRAFHEAVQSLSPFLTAAPDSPRGSGGSR
jgi:hypothetical protein